jgi:hypothetical protein
MTHLTDDRPLDRPGTGERRPSGYPPPVPGVERIPVPMRRRRPGLAALAVVLVLGGAALSAFLVLNSGQKQSAIIVKHEMRPGDPFTTADIEEGQVAAISASGLAAPIPWTDVGRLTAEGYRAKYALAAGSILTDSMVTAAVLPGPNCASAPIHLTDSQYPAEGLRRGDLVQLRYVPPTAGGADPRRTGLSPGDVLIERTYLSASRTGDSRNSLTISVVVPATSADDLRKVALAAAANSVYVVLLTGELAESSELQRCH